MHRNLREKASGWHKTFSIIDTLQDWTSKESINTREPNVKELHSTISNSSAFRLQMWICLTYCSRPFSGMYPRLVQLSGIQFGWCWCPSTTATHLRHCCFQSASTLMAAGWQSHPKTDTFESWTLGQERFYRYDYCMWMRVLTENCQEGNWYFCRYQAVAHTRPTKFYTSGGWSCFCPLAAHLGTTGRSSCGTL